MFLRVLTSEPQLATASLASTGAGWWLHLNQVNEVLTTLSLLIAIAAGALAIYRHFRDK